MELQSSTMQTFTSIVKENGDSVSVRVCVCVLQLVYWHNGRRVAPVFIGAGEAAACIRLQPSFVKMLRK